MQEIGNVCNLASIKQVTDIGMGKPTSNIRFLFFLNANSE